MDYLLKIDALTIVHSKLLKDGVNPILQFFKDSYSNNSLIKGVSLTVRRGEYLGLVGESGSGKSLTVKSVLGLVDVNPGIVCGNIKYKADVDKKGMEILSIPNNNASSILNNILSQTYKHSWHCKICLMRVYNQHNNDYDELLLKDEHFNNEYKNISIKLKKDYDFGYLIGLKQIPRKVHRFQKCQRKLLNTYKIAGKHISIILQDPISFLNPFWSINRQITNLRNLTIDSSSNDSMDDLLSEVKLNTDSFKTAIPRELSGGQGQRAMILLSSITKPKLLIADEPTTGLDVTLKKIVVEKFKGLREKISSNLSMIFISHDLGMVRRATDRINVMFNGEIIENCSSDRFNTSEGHHPYVSELLGITQSDYVIPIKNYKKNEKDLMGHGCSYFHQCSLTTKRDKCKVISPPPISVMTNDILISDEPDQPWVKCWNFLNE